MFARTETQLMMVDMAERLLRRENDFERRRARLAGPNPDRMGLWAAISEQGLIGALATEEQGGFGGTARDIASVMELVGEFLVVEPLLATALLIRAVGDDFDGIAGILEGKEPASWAHQEGSDPFALPNTRAHKAGNGWTLSGRKHVVRHASEATQWLVTAELDGQAALFLVNANDQLASKLRLLDDTGAASLIFEETPALLLDSGGRFDAVLATALVGLAAESAGIMDALTKRTNAYLKTRRQFGVALAEFQALQHRAAEMHIACEEVRALTERAIDAIDHGEPGSLGLAAATKAFVDDAARRVANEAVQLHGGMGVSDELDVSHYFRRIATIRAESGNASELRNHAFEALTSIAASSLRRDDAESSFRSEVRAFTKDHLPKEIMCRVAKGRKLDKEDHRRWQKILRDKGWFGATWPQQHGGAGWLLGRQLTLLQETAINDAPMIVPYGVSMVGPVLYTFGNPEQQQKHLPGILANDIWWCQGYSEPNSGSDLASLKTTARRDGDEYVVNGTKMWTTEAHWADWMHCLVRTSQEDKPQRGISFLLIDMKSPGIEVRPIVTLDGQHHTNQVFLDDVRVPVANLVGEEGDGWKIAKFLLANERVAIADTGPKIRLARHIRELFTAEVEASRLMGGRRAVLADRLAAVETRLAALIALEQHYVNRWDEGASGTGSEASVLKVSGTEILQELTEVALLVEGPMGAVHDPYDLVGAADVESEGRVASALAHEYLYSRCWSIFGGTNEIQRNIIAAAILR